MAAISVTHIAATGGTYYAFPVGESLADWLTERVQLVEAASPNLGRYSANLDESIAWSVFNGATQPTNWDQAVADIPKSVRAETGLASANLDAQLQADDILIEDSPGVWKLHKYAKGTTTDLVTPKTAKRPGGANLTDPTTQLLAGYQEE